MPTDYVSSINHILKPSKTSSYTAIDLFAGCGGLALGFSAQGFRTIGYEKDADACSTYTQNLKDECHQVVLTPESKFASASVVIGGPPCQPFSVGGHQHGLMDSRDGFPIFISAIEQLKPDIWMFENVRGLQYRNKWYLDEVIEALESQGYLVETRILNAVNYGVPQKRERLIVVGHKGKFSFPKSIEPATVAGDAIGDTANFAPESSKFLTKSMDEYVARYERASMCILPRDLYLDKPSRTVTCRNLAGATGDMMRVRLPDGRRRRLLLREAARLQSFPDWFHFIGSETSCFNQIGNAVPPLVSFYLAASVCEYLESAFRYSHQEIIAYNDQTKSKRSSDKKVTSMTQIKLLELRSEYNLSTAFLNTLNQTKQFKAKSSEVQFLINECLTVINSLGIPVDRMTPRQMEKMAMAFLALGDVTNSGDWSKLKDKDTPRGLRTREIIDFENKHFMENISSGSYDDIRRQDLLWLNLSNVVIGSKSGADTNDGTRGWSINPEYAGIVRQFGTPKWGKSAVEFMKGKTRFSELLDQKRNVKKVPVLLPSGDTLFLGTGEHNQLQKAIIEEFLPRFGQGPILLYVGDTSEKTLFRDTPRLEQLGFFDLDRGKLPDVVAYSESKNWLFLVEAVHSANPITKERLLAMKELTKGCSAELVYVTAFWTREKFKSFAADIAWETEVWIGNDPDHLIHFNGEKFLGPFQKAIDTD